MNEEWMKIHFCTSINNTPNQIDEWSTNCKRAFYTTVPKGVFSEIVMWALSGHSIIVCTD